MGGLRFTFAALGKCRVFLITFIYKPCVFCQGELIGLKSYSGKIYYEPFDEKVNITSYWVKYLFLIMA